MHITKAPNENYNYANYKQADRLEYYLVIIRYPSCLDSRIFVYPAWTDPFNLSRKVLRRDLCSQPGIFCVD